MWLVAAALAAALGVYFIFLPGGAAEYVEVTLDGVEVARLQLDRDTEIEAGGVTVAVSDGEVYVKCSDCPDKLCVDHSPVSREGESIVCLPNRVVITAYSGEDPEVDADT